MSSQYRKQRRHKARNKAYRPRPSGVAPMIVGAHLVLHPLERIVEQIERDGTVNVDDKGMPVFQAGDGQWYDAAGAIEGVMWHFEALEVRTKRTLPLDGLRELVIAFRYCVPVMQSTLDKLNASLPVLRRVMATGKADDQLDILQQTRIRAELEKRLEGASPANNQGG